MISSKQDKFVGKPTAFGQKINIDDIDSGKDFDVDYVDISIGGPGGCCVGVVATEVVSVDITKKLDKFLVKINKILIRSRFAVWDEVTDTVCPAEDPPGTPCPNYNVPEGVDEENGTEAPIYIGVSPAGGLSASEIQRQTKEMGGPWIAEDNLEANSYEVDISKFVPQPKDSDWTGNLVITFYWGNSAYYWYANTIISGLDFTITQKDQEFKI